MLQMDWLLIINCKHQLFTHLAALSLAHIPSLLNMLNSYPIAFSSRGKYFHNPTLWLNEVKSLRWVWNIFFPCFIKFQVSIDLSDFSFPWGVWSCVSPLLNSSVNPQISEEIHRYTSVSICQHCTLKLYMIHWGISKGIRVKCVFLKCHPIFKLSLYSQLIHYVTNRIMVFW